MSGVWSAAPIDTLLLGGGEGDEEEGYMTSNPTGGTSHIIFVWERKTFSKQRDRGANGGVLHSRKIHSFKIHLFIHSSSYINVIILSSGELIAVALGIREDNNFQ